MSFLFSRKARFQPSCHLWSRPAHNMASADSLPGHSMGFAPGSTFSINPSIISPVCFPLFRYVFLAVKQKLGLAAPGLDKVVALPATLTAEMDDSLQKQSQTDLPVQERSPCWIFRRDLYSTGKHPLHSRAIFHVSWIHGVGHVVLPYPQTWPYMTFLFVGPQPTPHDIALAFGQYFRYHDFIVEGLNLLSSRPCRTHTSRANGWRNRRRRFAVAVVASVPPHR